MSNKRRMTRASLGGVRRRKGKERRCEEKERRGEG